ncbi:MAG: hypothetical protein Q7K25_03050 [Actinomycetota bacterium]|nr:hypothetical protein [Actinomycetota bacterium]
MTMKKTSKTQTPKPSTGAPPKPRDRSAVLVRVTKEIGVDVATARILSRPEIGAAAIMEKWSPDTFDVNVLADELAVQVKAVNQGDMQRTEGMLLSQAHALDAIFVNLMRRSMTQTGLTQWEAYMRMGMKAQSQCRATLQVLAEIKNPRPVAFVKQANINNGGQQQVNNGSEATARPDPAPARKNETEQSKLLEGGTNGGTYLDTGAAQAAGRSDKALEPVEIVNRTKERKG